MKRRLAALAVIALLGGCRSVGDLTSENGGGVFQVRNPCPVVGIPTGTGDVTLFNPPSSTDSRAIDVTAAMSYVRSTCQRAGGQLISTATFIVAAQRRDTTGPRQVVLPYFDVVLQGGERVAAKQVGQIVLNFENGKALTFAQGKASVQVSQAAATLTEEARLALTRKRKAGGSEAAVDPLSDPAIRSAVASATFEHLIGFQLTQDQLRYNATR